MRRLSLKLVVAGAAISIGSIVGAAATSAATVAAPAAAAAVDLGSASSSPVQIDYHRYGQHNRPHRPKACTRDQAERKARRMGIRHPAAVVTRNIVRVSGWRRGQLEMMVFSRSPGCPIIR